MSDIPALTPDLPPPPAGPAPTAGMDEAAMRAAAKEFEAVFLGEMLRFSGLAEVPEAFGGGVGEEGFADMMIDEYARAIAETRSVGIAEQVYRVLSARAGA